MYNKLRGVTRTFVMGGCWVLKCRLIRMKLPTVFARLFIYSVAAPAPALDFLGTNGEGEIYFRWGTNMTNAREARRKIIWF